MLAYPDFVSNVISNFGCIVLFAAADIFIATNASADSIDPFWIRKIQLHNRVGGKCYNIYDNQ